jgi:hypothetical protein
MARKQLVDYLQAVQHVSQRRASQAIPISHKAVRCDATRTQHNSKLAARLKALGEQYPHNGHQMLDYFEVKTL